MTCSAPGGDFVSTLVSFVPLTRLAAGDEVSVRYVEMAHAPKHVRRRMLRQHFDFTCQCVRCGGRVDDAIRFNCPSAAAGRSCDGVHCDGWVPGYGSACVRCGATVEEGEDERSNLLAQLLGEPIPEGHGAATTTRGEIDSGAASPFAEAILRAVVSAHDGVDDSAAAAATRTLVTAEPAAITALLHASDAGWNALLRQRAAAELRTWLRDAASAAAAPATAHEAAARAWAGLQVTASASPLVREATALLVAETAVACRSPGATVATACAVAESVARDRVLLAIRLAARGPAMAPSPVRAVFLRQAVEHCAEMRDESGTMPLPRGVWARYLANAQASA